MTRNLINYRYSSRILAEVSNAISKLEGQLSWAAEVGVWLWLCVNLVASRQYRSVGSRGLWSQWVPFLFYFFVYFMGTLWTSVLSLLQISLLLKRWCEAHWGSFELTGSGSRRDERWQCENVRLEFWTYRKRCNALVLDLLETLLCSLPATGFHATVSIKEEDRWSGPIRRRPNFFNRCKIFDTTASSISTWGKGHELTFQQANSIFTSLTIKAN